MRILVLFAHPVETSFVAALHVAVVEALRAHGHEVDDCDLYREGFNPLLSRQERIDYQNVEINRLPVASYVDRLLAADGVVLVFPVWHYGFPAILKGFIDRVYLPGVSFALGPNGSFTPSLPNVKRLAAVCTYGGDHWRTVLVGDPPRRLWRSLRAVIGPRAITSYIAHYGENRPNPARRERFLAKVKQAFADW